MKILNEDNEEWREDGKYCYWSKFEKETWEQNNFNLIKALSLFLAMRVSGIKAKLIEENSK
jgi:hypothetical protein